MAIKKGNTNRGHRIVVSVSYMTPLISLMTATAVI